jgi:NTE family protein
MIEAHSFALILSGGLALGAYQAGACERLLNSDRLQLTAIAGTSIGAMNGAIIAGNLPEHRSEKLDTFWRDLVTDVTPAPIFDPLDLTQTGPVRQAQDYANALAARLSGVPGLYHSSLPLGRTGQGRAALYENEEVEQTLSRLIDFDLLNNGAVRFCCAATDLTSSQLVIFDTSCGARVTEKHLRASGGLIPNFPAVEVDGRLLADGGFSANSLLESLLASDAPEPRPSLCFLLELHPVTSAAPDSIERAAERSTDLQYAAQTQIRLAGLARERMLEFELAKSSPSRRRDLNVDLIHLSPAPSDRPQPLKHYDFSRRSLAERYQQGQADAEAALEQLDDFVSAEPGLHVHRVVRRG